MQHINKKLKVKDRASSFPTLVAAQFVLVLVLYGGRGMYLMVRSYGDRGTGHSSSAGSLALGQLSLGG